MPRKQRLKDEDGEDDELPSGLLPSKRIARKLRKQRLKDEDEEEDDELPSASCRAAKLRRKHLLHVPMEGDVGWRSRRTSSSCSQIARRRRPRKQQHPRSSKLVKDAQSWYA